MGRLGWLAVILALTPAFAVAEPYHDYIDEAAAELAPKAIAWRRDIHQIPELSNREVRTAALIAEHLAALGYENIRTGIAHTGVTATISGKRLGPTVALRADMDALPVTEDTGLDFASTVRTTYKGQEVGVMHACGHDAHVAVLMGVAEILAGMREGIPGRVQLIFQPAEEGPPPGENGGAVMMLEEGVFEEPVPEAIFALHVTPHDLHRVYYAPEAMLASLDRFTITVRGRQTHGSAPERGIDPIVVASQIVMGLQTIRSRQIGTRHEAVISVGQFQSGERFNIIPDEAVLVGTVRTLNEDVRADIRERMRRTAKNIAAAAGATAEVEFDFSYSVTRNNPDLVASLIPSLERVVGSDFVAETAPIMGAEDFAYFAEQVPAMYLFLGARPPEIPLAEAAWNHSPRFMVDEDVIETGMRLMAGLALDYLNRD
jgi:amidohydrolase